MLARLLHSVFALPLVISVMGFFPSVGTPVLAYSGKTGTTLKLIRLRTEYKVNPLGIDIRKPRLSWEIQSDGRGVTQSAYQVRVARTERQNHLGHPVANLHFERFPPPGLGPIGEPPGSLCLLPQP